MRQRQVIRSYDDLIKALANERVKRGMTCMDLEEVSGLQPGYVSKLENHFSHNRSKSSRFMGPVSFSLWVQGLGVGLIIIEDAKKQKRAAQHEPAKPAIPNPAKVAAGRKRQASLTPTQRIKLGKKGAKLRFAKMTPEARSAMASRAAKARWLNPAGAV